MDGTLSFYDRTWSEYKYGFNSGLDKSLWLGNENIHYLTMKDTNVTLRIDMWGDRAPNSSCSNEYWWEKHTSFYVSLIWRLSHSPLTLIQLDNEANNYTLHLSTSYTGNASAITAYGISYNIGKPFSAIDNSHDVCSGCCTGPPEQNG